MTWETPFLAAIVAAAVIPPLILLYFLKLRRRELNIPSTLFWQQSVQDLQANALFQRLRPNWLLFLQLLALIMILLALAQPAIIGPMKIGQRTVILIDRSASMSAVDGPGGSTRLDEAKKQALDFVREMDVGGLFGAVGTGNQVMVVGFANEAQVYSGFTSSKSQLENAIRSITPTDEGSQLKQALELARAYRINTDPEGSSLEVGPPATLMIYSDGRISDLKDMVIKEGEPVVYKPIGKGRDQSFNIGIAALGARRPILKSDDLDIYTRIENYSLKPQTVDVDMSVGDQLLQTRTITLPAAVDAAVATSTSLSSPPAGPEVISSINPGSNAVTFSITDPRGINIGISVHIKDDLPVDNQAWVVMPPAKQLTVALLSGADGWVLESAMSGVPFVRQIDRITSDRFDQLVASGYTSRYDLIVIDGVQPKALGPGRYLLFGVRPPIAGFGQADKPITNEALTWAEDHPINQAMNYYTLEIAPYKPITFPPTVHNLVEGANGPLVVEAQHDGISMIIVPFRPVASSWPFDANLVKFMQNTLDYLGHQGDALARTDIHPGDAIVARLPGNATHIEVHRPDGKTVALTPSDPAQTSYTTDLTGLYDLTYDDPALPDGKGSQYFAANLFDPAESDIAAAPDIRFGQDQVKAVGSGERVQKRPLWRWALMASLVFICIEWWVYNRRARI